MAIYVFTRITGTTEAGHRLSDKELEDLRTKRREVLTAAGGKAVAVYRSYLGRGSVYVSSYPSLEAAEKARLGIWSRAGLNIARYWTYEQDILYELPLES